jgi:hypothetical protein
LALSAAKNAGCRGTRPKALIAALRTPAIVKPSFKEYIEGNVQTTAGTTVRLDAKLEVGQASQKIEVAATAQVVRTENARVAGRVAPPTGRWSLRMYTLKKATCIICNEARA